MNAIKLLIIVVLSNSIINGCSVSKLKNVEFTGFYPLDTLNSLEFQEVEIEIKYLYSTYCNKDTNIYYWRNYLINNSYKIKHIKASNFGTISGKIKDSLEILGNRVCLTDRLPNNGTTFNFGRIYHTTFQNSEYLIILGYDRNETGNNINHFTCLLAKIHPDSTEIYCPPFSGNGNNSPYFPYFINDFDNDDKLDYLQLNNNGDSIKMYTLEANKIIKRPYYIKICNNYSINKLYVNKKESNWPFNYFATDSIQTSGKSHQKIFVSEFPQY